MIRQTLTSGLIVLGLGMLAVACKAGGVGDPCIPNQEFSKTYPGASSKGAAIEDRSFQCETRVCLVEHFQGRVTCPFGNSKGREGPVVDYDGDDAAECYVPGTEQKVEADVKPQCRERVGSVYCTCRCGGNDPAAKYCECPEGFTCAEVTTSLDPDLMAPGDKYCVKQGKLKKDGYSCGSDTCDKDKAHCGFTSNSYQL